MILACPQCRTQVMENAPCGNCGFVLAAQDGILRALTPQRRAVYSDFLRDYAVIRHAEGRGCSTAEYYRALPFQDVTGRNSAQWRIRAVSYRYLERWILPRRAADILDLGAGNGWLSWRVSLKGHRPVAVDIWTDEQDGLGAARRFGNFPCIESEFDRLPFADAQFDLAIFNASLHYSTDYVRTLREARRCLRPGGRIVVLDSPLYRRPEHGERMREERHRQFEAQYGFRSDALPSLEYLHTRLLHDLAAALQTTWQIHQPWYGWRWHMRPWKARLLRRRPPSRFCVLVAAKS